MNDSNVTAAGTVTTGAPAERTLAELAFDLVQLVWRRKVLFLVVGVLTFILSAAVTLMLPERFDARASILPTASGNSLSGIMSRLGSLPMVSDFGFGAGVTQLYPTIAKSNLIIGKVLESNFGDQTVLSYLREGKPADSLAVYEAKSRLKAAVSADASLRNGMVTIHYSNKNKYFAAFIVNSIVKNMESYLNSNSRDEIAIQMKTIESRLAEVTGQMGAAEQNLLNFWKNNRSVDHSPSLRITEKSLLRELEVNNGLYLELVRQHELIKIQDSGTSPILTVLDWAQVPMVRSWPHRSKIVLICLVITFLMTLGYLRFFQKSNHPESRSVKS